MKWPHIGRFPEQRHNKTHQHATDRRGVEQGSEWILGFAELACHDLICAVAKRRAHRQQRRPLDHGAAGPDDEQHSKEPDHHRQPASPANLLAKPPDREHGHQQRGNETDRLDLRHRQETQRTEVTGSRSHQQRGAQNLPAHLRRPQQRDAEPRCKQNQHEDQMRRIPAPHKHWHRIEAAQILGGRLQNGETHHHDHHEQDRAGTGTKRPESGKWSGNQKLRIEAEGTGNEF
jgi:hypothetical protein